MVDVPELETWILIWLAGAFILYVALRMLILELLSHPSVRAIAGVARKFGSDGSGGAWWERLAGQAIGTVVDRWQKGGGGPVTMYQPPPASGGAPAAPAQAIQPAAPAPPRGPIVKLVESPPKAPPPNP